jgi:phosphoribosyl 1,2-cyclic phosphodiesterase
MTLVEGARGRIVLEAGLSAREAARRLEDAGVAPGRVDAMVVSHEHQDHVRGALLFSRRHGVPVYAGRATSAAAGLRAEDLFGLVEIETGRPFEAGGMKVLPFPVPHDAADNVGFVVEEAGCRLGYATDLGYPTALVLERLRGCQILVVEANHDLRMLMAGPYPAHVKQRVMGRTGHLSNDQSADLLREAVTQATRAVFLAHLSEKNNDSALALESGRRALREAGRDAVPLHLTHRSRASAAVEV